MAHIQKVRKDGYASTTTSLRTLSGHDVKCWHGKTGGCYPETMKSFLENKTPVMVWHDGEKVYQLVAQDKMILPYEHFHSGKWFSALYQLASMTGAFQFYALKKELVDSGKMTFKQYHDAVMQENAMPVEMVRAILTNQSLTRNFKSSWRFYGK